MLISQEGADISYATPQPTIESLHTLPSLPHPADLSSMLKVRNKSLEYLWLVFNVVVV
jgi:hypothetical protein